MPPSSEEKNVKSEIAKEKPRDEHGHFIKSASDALGKITEITHDASDDEIIKSRS